MSRKSILIEKLHTSKSATSKKLILFEILHTGTEHNVQKIDFI